MRDASSSTSSTSARRSRMITDDPQCLDSKPSVITSPGSGAWRTASTLLPSRVPPERAVAVVVLGPYPPPPAEQGQDRGEEDHARTHAGALPRTRSLHSAIPITRDTTR